MRMMNSACTLLRGQILIGVKNTLLRGQFLLGVRNTLMRGQNSNIKVNLLIFKIYYDLKNKFNKF